MFGNLGKVELGMAVKEKVGCFKIAVSFIGYGLSKRSGHWAAGMIGSLKFRAHLVEHALCRTEGNLERVACLVVEVLRIFDDLLHALGSAQRAKHGGDVVFTIEIWRY
jgi:hypothetical protein